MNELKPKKRQMTMPTRLHPQERHPLEKVLENVYSKPYGSLTEQWSWLNSGKCSRVLQRRWGRPTGDL